MSLHHVIIIFSVIYCRYETIAKRKISSSIQSPVPQKKTHTDKENVRLATPLSATPLSVTPLHELPIQDLLQTPVRIDSIMSPPFAELCELPPTPVSGLKKPVSKSEREMLHEELDNLRGEKQALQTEVDNLKQTVEMVKLYSSSIEENDDRSRFYTGVTWNVFLTVFTFCQHFLKLI